MKNFIFTISLIALTGCSLQASLLGGSGEVTIHKTYEHRGEQHAVTMTFTIKEEKVENLTVTPEATSRAEEMIQIAFGANVRAALVGKDVKEITVPENIKERRLRAVLEEIIEELISQ